MRVLNPLVLLAAAGVFLCSGKPLSAAQKIPSPLSAWTLEEKIGQLLMVGFRSEKQIESIQPGAVILYSWNMKSVDRARQITSRLNKLAKKKLRAELIISVDHEGGKVQRLKKGMTRIPDALAVGAIEDEHLAFEMGQMVGRELSALGINSNLAPVLDIANAQSFLENRVWGEDPKKVAILTQSYIEGMQSVGILPVAKHFPGHGSSTVDAHFALPQVHKKLGRLWNEDLYPFRWAIQKGLPALMTAHVEIPAVDRGPASLSNRFLTRLLRQKFGYQGLVITDDLEMGGAASKKVEEVALDALRSGSDMLMIAWSLKRQKKIRDYLVQAVRNGELSEESVDEKLMRILSCKENHVQDMTRSPSFAQYKNVLRHPSHLALIRRIASESIRLFAGNIPGIRSELQLAGPDNWLVLLPEGYSARLWKKWRPRDELITHKKRMDHSKIQYIRERLKNNRREKKPTLVVSSPWSSSNKEFFKILQAYFAEESKSRAKGPRIWAHQGPVPVKVNANHFKKNNVAVLGLHSTSYSSLYSLRKMLFSPGEKVGKR